MEKALLGFTHFAAKIEATRLDDLSVDNVIEKVQKVSTADADLLTMESYNQALEEWKKAHPELVAQIAPEAAETDAAMTEAVAAEIFEKEFAPSAEAAEAVQEEEAVLSPTAAGGEAPGSPTAPVSPA